VLSTSFRVPFPGGVISTETVVKYRRETTSPCGFGIYAKPCRHNCGTYKIVVVVVIIALVRRGNDAVYRHRRRHFRRAGSARGRTRDDESYRRTGLNVFGHEIRTNPFATHFIVDGPRTLHYRTVKADSSQKGDKTPDALCACSQAQLEHLNTPRRN